MQCIAKNLVRNLGQGLSQSIAFALLTLFLFGCNGGSDTAPYKDPVPPNNSPSSQRAPLISGSPATTAPVSTQYDFTPTASDPNGDALTFQIVSAVALPSGMTFSTTNGRLRWMPTTAQSGMTVANIVISVSDGTQSSSLPAFSITATPPANRPPTITGTPKRSVQATVQYRFQAFGADPDTASSALRYSIQNAPIWADTTNFATTGLLVGTPTVQQVGTLYSRITISVSDGALTTSLPAFSILVTAFGNDAPDISGTPPTTAVVDQAYGPFTPTASDPNGNALTFSIAGKPSWATFNPANGALSGTPRAGDAGVYSGIVISVNDGQATVSLDAFTIRVSQIGMGVATLSWTAPTMNTDNTPLTDLAGYRIYYGTDQAALYQEIPIDIPVSQLTHQITNLDSGTYFFSVTARNSVGVESELSNVVSKTIQ
jgi:hypothetical protein